ncbi:MAG TPA: cation-transporting P-type ATPase, partial [Gammaproteobacteria bacterium]|nr:cation-transporting P-type ATPase [Gammaproteobacteria bacterium]
METEQKVERISSTWHALGVAETLQQQGVSGASGLSLSEVEQRRAKHGPNALPETKRRSLIHLVLGQFQSPLIYILFVAALLALFLAKHGDAVVILVVVLVNAVIGVIQEGRAERSMAALQQLSALRTHVMRDGVEQMVAARELVPGDIIILTAGDAVGADARLLKAAALETGEAALTGESLPVMKHADVLPADTLLADRDNMIYSGTHITAGRAHAVVVATGLATEVGKIASLTATAEDPQTPLEIRIAQFGRYLVAAALLLFVVVLGLGYVRG